MDRQGQNGCSLYKLWIKFQRISRAPGKRKLYIGLFIAVQITVTLLGKLACNSCFSRQSESLIN